MRDLTEPAIDRFRCRDAAVVAMFGGTGDAATGVFQFPSPVAGRSLKVIVASGFGFEHASVSVDRAGRRCPTWEEMESVKRRLWRDEEVAMQLHVAVSDHINCHPGTLHLWRPTDPGVTIPLPPRWMVAPYEGQDDDIARDERARRDAGLPTW